MNSDYWMLWVVGGLGVAFMLYVVIDGVAGWMKRRRIAARMSEPEEVDETAYVAPPEEPWSEFLEGDCNFCKKTLYLPKMGRFKPFICPNCHQLNPPLKKDPFGTVKRFLRWLLYPSFQDRF